MANRLIIFVLVILAGILFIGSVSAESCEVRPISSCTGSFNNIVFKLSSSTNAHAELANQSNYNYALCCDFAKAIPASCNVDSADAGTYKDNRVLSLYSLTNSHAEVPNPSTPYYPVGVCYQDLECIHTSGTCPGDYPIETVSLLSQTNSHVSAYGTAGYAINICCRDVTDTSTQTCTQQGGTTCNPGDICNPDPPGFFPATDTNYCCGGSCCTPQSDTIACVNAGAQCGIVTNNCEQQVSCPNTCTEQEECQGNRCVCVPEPIATTCENEFGAGYQCGTATDNCGNVVDCGGCPSFTSQLIVHYKFDENSGTFMADSSGNGHDGTTLATPEWVAGSPGSALRFTGATLYGPRYWVEAPNNAQLHVPNGWMFEAKVKLDQNPNTATGTYQERIWPIIQKHAEYFLRFDAFGSDGDTGNQLACAGFRTSSFDGVVLAPGTFNWQTGQWYDIKCVWNGTWMGLYVNGNLEASRNLGFVPVTSNYNLMIGGYQGTIDGIQKKFKGTIDEVKISSYSSSNPSANTCDTGIGMCVAPSCELNDAYWSASEVEEGTQVTLTVEGTPECSGKTAVFDIGEVDGSSNYAGKDSTDTSQIIHNRTTGIFNAQGIATSTWIAEWQNDNGFLTDADPEYVFLTTISGISPYDDSGQLKVTPYTGTNQCSDFAVCADATDSLECQFVNNQCPGVVNVSNLGQCGGSCPGDPWNNCACYWDSTSGTCKASSEQVICLNPSFCGDGYIDNSLNETCDGTNFTQPMVTCENLGQGTTGVVTCRVDNCQYNISQCGDVQTGGFCGDDILQSPNGDGDYESCDGTDWGGIIACSDLGEFTGGTLDCDSSCNWDLSNCQGGIDGPQTQEGFSVGNCSYDTTATSDCNEDPIGFYVASWDGSWTWGSLNTGWQDNVTCAAFTPCTNTECVIDDKGTTTTLDDLWYCDPQNKFFECTGGGENTIECPAEIRLPFFGGLQIIITLLVVGVIYGMMALERRKK